MQLLDNHNVDEFMEALGEYVEVGTAHNLGTSTYRTAI